MAFELGQRWWQLGFTPGLGQRPRTRRVAAGAMDVVLTEIARAKTRFRVSADARVISCYEAGRDGFWLHRSPDARASPITWSIRRALRSIAAPVGARRTNSISAGS